MTTDGLISSVKVAGDMMIIMRTNIILHIHSIFICYKCVN